MTVTPESFAQSLVFGLLVGALYGLAAAGLSLVFGVMKVLNVAHGDLLMLGGYGSFWLFTLYGVDPFVSLLIIGPALFVIGLALELALFRPLTRFDEETKIKNSLLIGFGLALVLENLAIRLWTADERGITTAYAGTVARLGAINLPLDRLGNLAVALAVIVGLHLFLTRTYLGKGIRATAEDWQAATLVGINVRRTYLIAFALGTALAGVAGTLVTVGFAVSPTIGLDWTLKALIVVVLAGLGSVFGTFVGGLLLGLGESLVTLIPNGGSYRELVGLVLFVVVLLVRPQGLFGRSR
ncbi:MAG TPA: branched-chain amino acid ABC transporter permease [Chloroflexota bacterium]|nr:branched-chain amino acid ABC transporter permease [Chloroflexota bacterium]